LDRKVRAGSSPAIGTKILRGKRLLDLIQEPFSRFGCELRPLRMLAHQLALCFLLEEGIG